LLIAVVSIFVVVALLGCSSTLQIADVFASPIDYQQEITLTATVTIISAESPTAFAIVDNAHILQCGNLNCNTMMMWANNVSGGPMPVPGDVVTMTGRFEYLGTWIFVADSITVDNNIIDRLAPL